MGIFDKNRAARPNQFKEVYGQIEKLASTASSNEKQLLIKQFVQDELFARVVQYALDSRLVYHVKKLPKFVQGKYHTAEELFAFLDYLSDKPGASKSDKEKLHRLACSSEEAYHVISRIIKKDLRCGCSVKLFNKAVPDFIFDIPYCRCSSDKKIKNITTPAYAQEKADGIFGNMVVDDDMNVYFLTREGKRIQQLHRLENILRKRLPVSSRNSVQNGELLVMVDGVILDRKTGNGIINSCIYGTADQKMADCVVYKTWDIIPAKAFWGGTYNVQYEKRYSLVKSIVASVDVPQYTLVDTVQVENIDEAYAFFRRMRSEGKEGAVIKDFKAVWKYHTSPLQVKLKNVTDVELEIVGWYYGDTGKKYGQCLGGLHCRSACGRLEVNVGTGFSDDERGYRVIDGVQDLNFAKKQIEYWESQVGSIVQLECESVIQDKRGGKPSLFLPRYIEVRKDKSKADTLEDILKR